VYACECAYEKITRVPVCLSLSLSVMCMCMCAHSVMDKVQGAMALDVITKAVVKATSLEVCNSQHKVFF
jgi:hypothetical protein